jgi:tetratricopeptide (TPR) repeat protein
LGFRTGRKYAITWCKKAENYSDVKALECHDEAIKRDPEFAEPWYQKGKIFAKSKDWMWDGTISPYIAGMAEPKYPEKFTGPIANKYRETLKCFDKATELDPKFVDAWFAKGKFYWKHDNGERDAIQCLSNAIALDSKFEPAWFVKAEALASLGRHEESLKCYDEAIALLPTDAKEKRYDEHGRYYFFDRWAGKADLLSELGKHEEAIKCYDKALEMVGRDEGYNVFAKKGITLASLGRHEESIKCYDEALKRMGYRSGDSLPKMNLAKADALSELGESVSDETPFKCYSSAIRFYTDKLFDGKHNPVEDEDWEEGVKKLQETCSQAINGLKKWYRPEDD